MSSISEMSSIGIPVHDWNTKSIGQFVFCLLFKALYSYYRSAVGSSLEVPAFHILAGPDVCIHSVYCFESLMFLLILRFQISPASPVRVCPDPSHLALTDLLSSFEAFIRPMMYCMPCLWSSVQFMEFISHSKASWISGDITVLWGPSAVCGLLTMINPWLRGFTSTMGFQMHEEAMCFSSQRYICLWLSE